VETQADRATQPTRSDPDAPATNTPADAGRAEHLRKVQEVVGLWVEMQSLLQAHFAALAAEHSLSAIQAKVLMQLDPAGAVTMRALAGRLQYDPSNLTTVIDKLEVFGAVRRRPDPRDRRVKGLVLTDKGRQIREAFWHRLINDTGPMGGLDVAELDQLRSLLRTALAGAEPDANAGAGERPETRPSPAE
jgi:DNA-binding MarR family transcriptional regulator